MPILRLRPVRSNLAAFPGLPNHVFVFVFAFVFESFPGGDRTAKKRANDSPPFALFARYDSRYCYLSDSADRIEHDQYSQHNWHGQECQSIQQAKLLFVSHTIHRFQVFSAS